MVTPILAVRDVDASVAFYTHKLGFRLKSSQADPDGRSAFARVGLGGGSLGLSRAPELMRLGNGVVFEVEVPGLADLNAYCAELRGKGVATNPAPRYGGCGLSVRDPDGYTLVLVVAAKPGLGALKPKLFSRGKPGHPGGRP